MLCQTIDIIDYAKKKRSLALFRDNLHDLYDKLYNTNAEQINHPKDFYSALSEATYAARDSHYADLDTLYTMYLLEFYMIVKIGGMH
jgi:hypothetical protein